MNPENQTPSQPQFQPQPAQPNVLTIPLAIIIAGVVIAGGIVATKYVGAPSTSTPKTTAATASMPFVAVTADDHILGKFGADLTFVEYSDPECPFCKVFHGTMHQILSDYGIDSGKITWVYRHLPLYKPDATGRALHSRAGKEAEATECANELGGNEAFWKLTDLVYQTTTSNFTLDPAQLPIIAGKVGLDVNTFNTCLASGKYKAKVDQQYAEGFAAGAQGTPFIIVVSKKKITGAMQDKIIANILAVFSKIAPQSTVPPDLVSFDTDGTRVPFSGALPIEIVKSMIDTLTK